MKPYICQNIIPQAIIVFLKAKTYNDCVTMSINLKVILKVFY